MLFYYTCRIVCTAIILNFNVFSDYFHYDLVADFLIKLFNSDSKFPLVLWPNLLLFFYADYSVHFCKGLLSFCLGYDLIVLNPKNFFVLNPQFKSVKIFKKVLWEKVFNSDQIKFKIQSLPNFPYLHRSSRCQAVLYSFVFEIFMASFVVFLGFLCFLLLCYLYFAKIYPVYIFWQSIIMFVDITMILYLIWHSFKLALFILHTLYLVIYVLSAQQKIMNETVQVLTKSKFKKSKIAQLQLAVYLNKYIKTQLRNINLLLFTNKEFISTTLCLCMLTMFGVNVYSVAMITLRNLQLINKMILVAICALQFIVIILGVMRMIMVSKALYSSNRYLYRAQFQLDASYLSLKIKLLTMYEVLNGGKKFAYTVGPVGKLTSRALMKVFFS